MATVTMDPIHDLIELLKRNPTLGDALEALHIVEFLKDVGLLSTETYDQFLTEQGSKGTIYCSIKDGVFNFTHLDCSVFHAGNLPATPEESMYKLIYNQVNHYIHTLNKVMTNRDERIKEREGDRLYRSLRRLFGKRFGFQWTNDETSYFDGKDIFVKYDLQTANHRPFTDTELRALRHGHGVHEAGHAEYDYLPDYIDWQKEMTAQSKQDYLDNQKYPLPWLQFFGNMGLDGRMERLIMLKTPSQRTFLDLNNYEWRFGDRYEGIGQSNLIDFRQAYAHRVLGMDDMDEWLEDAVDLVNSVQPIIEQIRTASSTKSSLTYVTTLIRAVWPTLLEWMDLEDQEPSDEDSFTDDMTQGSWSESAEAAEKKAEAVNEQYDSSSSQDSGGEEERKKKTEAMLRQIEKGLEKDKTEVDQELAELAPSEMQVNFKGEVGELSSIVEELPIPRPNLPNYHDSRKKIQRYIKPVARELSALLQGIPEQPRRNVRSGRFMAGQAWRAVHCEDTNVFSKHLKGTPKEDAFIACMMDVSGSTYGTLANGEEIYEEMRRALSLLLEASDTAGIPTEAYAFTEDEKTLVFRLKPTDAPLSDTHRGSIGGIYPLMGNRDTVALKYMLDRVQKRTEGIRIAIMLSDGIPVFKDGEGPGTIQRMVKDAEKQGIMVLCLFIGRHDNHTIDLVKEMYPGRMIAADKGIAKELQKHVKRIIRQQR